MRRKYWVLSIVLITLFMLAVPTVAALDNREGEEVIIGAEEVVADDIYIGAQRLIVDGVVQGDIYAMASEIVVNGVIEGDLVAGAQSIIINGEVTDDARLGAAVVQLGEGALIGDDLLSFGYSLETLPGSEIGGSLLFGGGQLLHAGVVNQDLYAGANSLALLGHVEGDVIIDVGDAADAAPFDPFQFMPEAFPGISPPTVPPGFTLSEEATVAGTLDYRTGSEIALPAAAVDGDVVFTPTVEQVAPEPTSSERMTAWFLRYLQRFLALLVIGLLLLWLTPNFSRGTVRTVGQQPLNSLGWGCIGVIAIPFILLFLIGFFIALAVLLGLITLGGLAGTVLFLGLLLVVGLAVVFGLLIAYLTYVIIALFTGQRLLGAIKTEWRESRFWALVIGLLLIVALTLIPIVGLIARLIVVLLGLGAFWLFWRGRLGPTLVDPPLDVSDKAETPPPVEKGPAAVADSDVANAPIVTSAETTAIEEASPLPSDPEADDGSP